MVLEGKWGQEAATLGLEEQEAFWRPLFEAPSKPDDRPVPQVEVNWQIVDPVRVEEVAKALRDSEDSAPGSDGITLRDLKSVSSPMLAATYNLWLLAGYTPERVVKGETILIPKGGGLTDPANYRPITMVSRVTRVLHKVFASRLTSSLAWILGRRRSDQLTDAPTTYSYLIRLSRKPSGEDGPCPEPSLTWQRPSMVCPMTHLGAR